MFFIQFSNPAGYPPLLHAVDILLLQGWKVCVLGINANETGALSFPPRAGLAVRMLRQSRPGWRKKFQYLRFTFLEIGRAHV